MRPRPKMVLDPEKDVDGFALVTRAASILAAHGFKKEARAMHYSARLKNYSSYHALKLVKEYMDV